VSLPQLKWLHLYSTHLEQGPVEEESEESEANGDGERQHDHGRVGKVAERRYSSFPPVRIISLRQIAGLGKNGE